MKIPKDINICKCACHQPTEGYHVEHNFDCCDIPYEIYFTRKGNFDNTLYAIKMGSVIKRKPKSMKNAIIKRCKEDLTNVELITTDRENVIGITYRENGKMVNAPIITHESDSTKDLIKKVDEAIRNCKLIIKTL